MELLTGDVVEGIQVMNVVGGGIRDDYEAREHLGVSTEVDLIVHSLSLSLSLFLFFLFVLIGIQDWLAPSIKRVELT